MSGGVIITAAEDDGGGLRLVTDNIGSCIYLWRQLQQVQSGGASSSNGGTNGIWRFRWVKHLTIYVETAHGVDIWTAESYVNLLHTQWKRNLIKLTGVIAPVHIKLTDEIASIHNRLAGVQKEKTTIHASPNTCKQTKCSISYLRRFWETSKIIGVAKDVHKKTSVPHTNEFDG